MSDRGCVSPRRTPALYRRIGYQPDLEAEGLERLSRLDAGGSRHAFTRLAMELDASVGQGSAAQLAHLLLDVLQRINRRVHPHPDQREACELTRAALIRQFATCRSADSARRRFLAALDRLLPASPTATRPAHPLVARAVTFIELNYARRVSLSSVAGRLHVSPGYLSRIFRRETGATVTAFLHRVRLANARPLLADDRRSLAEIAYRVGYRNYRDFYRNFVKQERASPRQVRRRLHEAAATRAS